MKHISIVLLSGLLGLSAHALPQKYNNCSNSKKIKSPKNSQGFYMNATCDKAYVLPPIGGDLEVTGYLPLYADADCNNLEDIETNIEDLRQRLEVVSEQEEQAFQGNARYRDQRITCAKKEASWNALKATHQGVVESLEEQKLELANIEAKLVDCEGSQGPQRSLCEFYQSQVQILPVKIVGNEFKASSLKTKIRKAKAKSKNCDIKLESIATVIRAQNSDLASQREQLETDILKQQTSLRGYRTILTGESGAKLGIHLLSGQEAIRKDFQRLNGGLSVEFANMPISTGLLTMQFVVSGEDADLPVIRRSYINGILNSPEVPASLEELSNPTLRVDSFLGQAISGEIELNSYGACKIKEKAERENISPEQVIASIIKPSGHFSYLTQVKRMMEIKYNESHLYQLIKKNSNKKSGLFKSKSVSSVTETSNAKKWINVKILSEDPNLDFLNTQQIIADIRAEYVDSALMRVARSYTSASPTEPGPPGPTGASQASAVLKKCPNYYCQVASFGLDLGNALFGGSTSESRMTRIVEASESQTYTDIKSIPSYATQVYDFSQGSN